MRPRTGIAAFVTVLSAPALDDQVVRGVSFTPGTR
jgi:hypothetical protein